MCIMRSVNSVRGCLGTLSSSVCKIVPAIIQMLYISAWQFGIAVMSALHNSSTCICVQRNLTLPFPASRMRGGWGHLKDQKSQKAKLWRTREEEKWSKRGRREGRAVSSLCPLAFPAVLSFPFTFHLPSPRHPFHHRPLALLLSVYLSSPTFSSHFSLWLSETGQVLLNPPSSSTCLIQEHIKTETQIRSAGKLNTGPSHFRKAHNIKPYNQPSVFIWFVLHTHKRRLVNWLSRETDWQKCATVVMWIISMKMAYTVDWV